MSIFGFVKNFYNINLDREDNFHTPQGRVFQPRNPWVLYDLGPRNFIEILGLKVLVLNRRSIGSRNIARVKYCSINIKPFLQRGIEFNTKLLAEVFFDVYHLELFNSKLLSLKLNPSPKTERKRISSFDRSCHKSVESFFSMKINLLRKKIRRAFSKQQQHIKGKVIFNEYFKLHSRTNRER